MKQIGNWVFGSFFRTIGRLLVFVLLGFIIANVVDFGSIIDNFNITDLFFTKVSAATLVETVKQVGNGYLTVTNASQFTDTNTFYIKTVYSSTTTNDVRNFEYTFADNIRPTKTNGDYIGFQILNSQPTDVSEVDTATYRYCSKWEVTSTVDTYYGSSGDYEVYPSVFTCRSYSTYSGDTITTIQSTEFNHNNIAIRISYANGGWSMCEIHDNQVYCPLNSSGATAIRIIYDFVAENTTSMNIGLSRGYLLYKSTDAASAIEQQTQQQQQQHNEMMDSNTTTAEDDAEGFFDDFSVDLGGLTGIITAPLTTIQNLLNSTCTNLVLPLPFVNENLTLPCLSSIYSEHFGAFFTLYQTIILGIIAYRCIMSIFFDIKGFTNPDDDRIEVMDL